MGPIEHLHRLLGGMLGDRLVSRANPAFAVLAEVVYSGPHRAPVLIARPRNIVEVSAVVRAVRETGVFLTVRGRGHSFARHGIVGGGLVLDLRLMDGVQVDVAARVGTAQAATSTGRYTAAAAEHGLATGFGDNPDVGVPGLVTGGGFGFISRRDGLTIDNLIDAVVVLGDGSQVTTSATENPDLFWAIRGGGGNFGVITKLRLRLAQTPSVNGGFIAFEPDPATAEALFAAAQAAPDELSLMISVTKAPPAPYIPEHLHGAPIVTAVICHADRPEESERALAPFRAAGKVVVDRLRTQPYPELFTLASDQAGTRTVRQTGFLDAFTLEQAAHALELVENSPTDVAVVNLRPMGGRIARVPADETAFAYRDRGALATIRSVDRDPERAQAGVAWTARAGELLGIGGPANVNFLGETPRNGAALAYPEPTLARLRAVKAHYDPKNLFRSNHNIEPEPAPALGQRHDI